MLYVLGYLSLAVAVLLLVYMVCTVRPRAWARPVIVNGAVAGLLGIVVAVEWYRHGLTSVNGTPDRHA